jgi:ABC-type antimicrobial peptide transport system permease subunit
VPVVPTGVALALAASTLVGLLSGVYPAQRASQLNIVEALRFD